MAAEPAETRRVAPRRSARSSLGAISIGRRTVGKRKSSDDRCYPIQTAASAVRVFLHAVRGLRIHTVRRHMTLTKEDKQQIVGQHGKGEADTGSAEVQIALLTRADQRPDRALATALEGSPFAPRPAQAGRSPPAAAQLPAAQGSRGLPRPDQGAGPQAVARKTRLGSGSLSELGDQSRTDSNLHSPEEGVEDRWQ